MGRSRFYVLASAVSVLLAIFLTVLTNRFYPSTPQDERTFFGLLTFIMLSFCLFVMYDVWSIRFERGGWVALKWVAVAGLLVASTAGLHLYFLELLPFKGFLFSLFIVQTTLSLIERWRLDGRQPEATAELQSQRRALMVVDGIFVLAACYLLIFWIEPESGWSVLAGLTMALILLTPMIWGLSLRIRAQRSGQTPIQSPPAVTK